MNSEVDFDGEASVLAALAGAASCSALRFLGASSCSDSLEDEPEEASDSASDSSEAEEASDSADSEASEATSASESDSDELDSVSLSSTFLPLAALTATFFSDSLEEEDEDESSESDSDDDSLATTLALAGAVFFLVSTSDSDDDDEEESDDDSEEDSLALPLLTILELVSFLEDGLVTDFVVMFMLETEKEDRRWVAKKLQILATLTGVKILNVDYRGMVNAPRLLFLFSFEIK